MESDQPRARRAADEGRAYDAARTAPSGRGESRWPLGLGVRADAPRARRRVPERSAKGDRSQSARMEDVSVARPPEPLCTRVSHHQHEDTGWACEENRRAGRHVGTRRNASPGASLRSLAGSAVPDCGNLEGLAPTPGLWPAVKEDAGMVTVSRQPSERYWRSSERSGRTMRACITIPTLRTRFSSSLVWAGLIVKRLLLQFRKKRRRAGVGAGAFRRHRCAMADRVANAALHAGHAVRWNAAAQAVET